MRSETFEKTSQSLLDLVERTDLQKPISATRKIPFEWLFNNLSKAQFETVMNCLRDGSIKSEAHYGWLDITACFKVVGKKKLVLMASDWCNTSLCYPKHCDVGPRIHLIDNENERAFVDITLHSSLVNRALGLTGQRGGKPPRMGPRLYAWLTVWYARDDLPEDPEEVFAIVAEDPELWENGIIADASGIAAIKKFLSYLEEFDKRPWPPCFYLRHFNHQT